jgi:transcriptional regulator of acetoin/glycerol metabolism
MGSDPPLRLDPVSLARWRDFHAGRLSDAEADPVLSRWKRALAAGISPEGQAAPHGVADSDLVERRARVEALLGGEDMTDVSADLVERPLVAVLSDDEGVIVHADARGYDRRATTARLVEGARWAEGARGTNAIGTAIAERRSVAVIGSAHYERANHALFCYAAPIFDPYGILAGVFDVSGDVEDDDPTLGLRVRQVASAMQTALRARAYAAAVSGGARIVERMLERSASPAVLLEAPGLVRRANDRARAALRLEDPTGTSTERLFGVSWDVLSKEALRASDDSIFETASSRYRLSFDPIVGPGGRVLSVVVHFDPAPLPARTAARAPDPLPGAFDALFGEDAAVLEAKRRAARFARTPVPILLLAETGTGKELMARAIHAASDRARGAFVAVNCGALSSQLLASELFGYAPGSFTGARAQGQEGKIGAANGGTLFLDEIGEMSPELQAMLLRVLEDGTYARVGEATTRRADFRLVCATCRDLPALVRAGSFRSDLFHRIHGAAIGLPPLRSRTDRVELAEAILDELARDASLDAPALGRSAKEHIRGHVWPGNVRELKNALRHALYLAADTIERADFPDLLLEDARASAPISVRSRAEAETEAVRSAVEACGGNLTEAAKRLGVSRSTLYRMLARARPSRR